MMNFPNYIDYHVSCSRGAINKEICYKITNLLYKINDSIPFTQDFDVN